MTDECRICGYPLAGGECDNGCNQDAVIISLESDFRGFMSRVFSDPDTVGIEQETEMRRAFMAGCWNVVTHCAVDPERLYQAKRQCWKFLEMVKAGTR